MARLAWEWIGLMVVRAVKVSLYEATRVLIFLLFFSFLNRTPNNAVGPASTLTLKANYGTNYTVQPALESSLPALCPFITQAKPQSMHITALECEPIIWLNRENNNPPPADWTDQSGLYWSLYTPQLSKIRLSVKNVSESGEVNLPNNMA